MEENTSIYIWTRSNGLWRSVVQVLVFVLV